MEREREVEMDRFELLLVAYICNVCADVRMCVCPYICKQKVSQGKNGDLRFYTSGKKTEVIEKMERDTR